MDSCAWRLDQLADKYNWPPLQRITREVIKESLEVPVTDGLFVSWDVLSRKRARGPVLGIGSLDPWLPLSRALGVTEPIACPKDMGFFQEMVTTSCDWKISTLGWVFTLFFVFLGSSAAIWGGWLETAGPRKAGVVAAFCWCGGLLD